MSVTPETPHVYDVNTFGFEKVKEAVDKANRRLERAGIEQRFELDFHEYEKLIENEGTNYLENRIEFTVNHPEISYNGYTFKARIEQAAPGVFVAFTAPNQELDGWIPEHMDCEHCHKKIARTKVYAIEDEQGIIKTVGGKCIELYTGLKPQGLWAMEYDPLADLDDRDYGYTSNTEQIAENTNDLLRNAYVITQDDKGYRSVSAYGTDSTADRVDTVMYGRFAPSDQAQQDEQYAADTKERAQEVNVEELKAEIQKALADNDTAWANNIRALLNAEYITRRSRNLLISSLSAMYRERKKQEKVEQWAKGFLGVEDEKIHDIKARVMYIKEREEEYGYNPKTVFLITMKSESGHKLFWKTSSYNIPEEHDSIVLNATVRDTSTYNNVDSTRIIRPKWKHVVEE